MNDTPDHIKKIQLEIWLAKTPGERLYQFVMDNDALYKFWDKEHEKNSAAKGEKDANKAE